VFACHRQPLVDDGRIDTITPHAVGSRLGLHGDCDQLHHRHDRAINPEGGTGVVQFGHPVLDRPDAEPALPQRAGVSDEAAQPVGRQQFASPARQLRWRGGSRRWGGSW